MWQLQCNTGSIWLRMCHISMLMSISPQKTRLMVVNLSWELALNSVLKKANSSGESKLCFMQTSLKKKVKIHTQLILVSKKFTIKRKQILNSWKMEDCSAVTRNLTRISWQMIQVNRITCNTFTEMILLHLIMIQECQKIKKISSLISQDLSLRLLTIPWTLSQEKST